jgi:hypothetical protein
MTELTPSVADPYACVLDGVTATAPDGGTAPINECAWMQMSPCGCVSGITMAMHGGDTVLLTADAALREMAANAADAREDAKLGYRMVLIRMVDYREHLIEAMTAKCPHVPKWGVQRQTREVGDRTWTRYGSTDWRHVDSHGTWRLEKWSSYWHVQPPTSLTKSGMWIPGMSSQLVEALERASAYADQLGATAPVAADLPAVQS